MENKWTESQLEAIKTLDQNMQIIACAGSGKTSTMVKHILHLLEQPDTNAENIVAITYTEKAAAALKHKIYEEYEKKNQSLEGLASMYVGTIHGFCLFLLQEFSDEYKVFETLNEVQTKLLIKKTRQENGIFDAQYHPTKGKAYPLVSNKSSSEALSNAITAYKNFLDIGREYGKQKLPIPLQNHINKYESVLKKNNYFDFTSIIMTTLSMIINGNLNENGIKNIKHLIIDEYQDVNDAQEKIIRYFYDNGTRICVVGDDDQTIYQWRGSNLRYIKDFANRYDNVKSVALDINFRSSEGITEIAKQVINHNISRLNKDMKSNKTQSYEQGDIITYEFESKEEEVDFIVKKIQQLIGVKYTRKEKEFGINYDDIVILVSSVKKISSLIERLELEKISFIVEGTKNLFDTEEIKILRDTYECIFNALLIKDTDYQPEVVKEKLINIVIPSELITRWKHYSPLGKPQIKDILKQFCIDTMPKDEYEFTIQGHLKMLFSRLQLISTSIDEKVLYNWGKFTEIVNDFEKIYLQYAPYYRMKAFETFLKQDAPEIYPEGWLSPNFKAIRCLRIMTYHQAKGLEYPIVFMPFLTKYSIFPQKNPGGSNAWGIFNDEIIRQQYDDGDEGIRRVFYVGMTRSEKYLFLTRSNNVSDTGKTTYNTPAFPFVEAKHSLYKETKLFLDKSYEHSSVKKFSGDEIITLNFSLLKDLFDCPFKFKMLNIFGFHSPLNIRMGYGKSIHNMLDYVHKNYSILDLNNEVVIRRIVGKYLNLPYGSPKLIKAMSEKAFINLTSYIKNNKAKFEFIKFTEKSIDYSLNEYMFINGRIDLVRDELNHTITIVDFKSSAEVLSKEQIKNQLLIYVLGYESLTGEKVDYIESYDFNSGNPTTIELLPNDRTNFRKVLSDCQSTIKNSKYPKAIEIDSKNTKNYCEKARCEFIDSCFPNT